jgi:serine/threonine protein kinase
MSVVPLPVGTFLRADGTGRFAYLVERNLGQGGFGITYLVRTSNGQRLVVKELACAHVSSRTTDGEIVAISSRRSLFERLQKRFLDEARKLAQLAAEDCPNIVRVYEAFRERGTVYFVMEWIEDSRPLPVRNESTALSPEEWATIEATALDLLAGLETIHRWFPCHGDLKPDNLLRTTSGRTVIIDFGTARRDEEISATVRTTMYTPGYAPLELSVRSGAQLHAGPASDLYSFAMVVWGMCRRHHDVVHDDALQSDVPWPTDPVLRVTPGQSDPYANAARQLEACGVPANWARAIEACLAVRIDQRPRTVADVRQLLVQAPQPVMSLWIAGFVSGGTISLLLLWNLLSMLWRNLFFGSCLGVTFLRYAASSPGWLAAIQVAT